MALVDITGVSRYLGARCIFSSVNLSVPARARIGVVGRNGEGKSTLLRVIAGELEPDSGKIHKASGVRLGYLSQGLPDYTSTVFEEAMAGKPEVLQAASKMRELETKMAASGIGDTGALLREYAKAQGRFEALNGYALEHEIAAILAGLGLREDTWQAMAKDLSGGQKVRLNLAKLLVSQPDVLLLDEPTNHLDIGGVEWLESFLSRYPGAMVIVSHDRRFLDTLVDRIWEVEAGKVTPYRGNFSAFIQQKQELLKRQAQEYAEQQELIKRTQLFIQKWKANARRTGQARSREKMLQRLELVDKPKQHATLKLKLTPSSATGREVLLLKGFSKGFDRMLFSGIDLLVFRGERIALVGPNGCGKTTFIKCLMGIEPYEGIVKWGAGVRKAYYAQDFVLGSPERSVLDEVMSLGVPHAEARDLLGRFLFSGDDVKKQTGNLSGGEKSRLALLRLVYSDANVLLLDEPTNHLDLPSRRALEDALADFQGTIVFASHDRYFIDRIATKLLWFEDGAVTVFEGNYSAFKQSREEAEGFGEEESASRRETHNRKPQPATAASSGQEVAAREIAELDARIEAIESEISRLEEREQELASVLADPDTYSQSGDIPLREWGQVRVKLAELYSSWEAVMKAREQWGGEERRS
ncbi:MAG: ABC-F family ATP-binding cassette domain-containing protein [Bacillota bacterium]|jgi:ATP-binding cassette subfamily F protein 3|nr:ABC-F family ATP-binding cassette domain-containing protein [Candidatus Fermentithermobacillaceae bacterium]